MDLKSGFPFSLIRYGLPYEYPRLNEPLKTDVLILGAGISGALVAYYLSRAGVNCTVVDKRSVGLGSTCASTSLLQYEIDVPLHKLIQLRGEKAAVRSYELCREAIYALADLSHKIGLEQFELNQSLWYAAYQKHVPLVKDEFVARVKYGFDVQFLEAAEIIKKFGFAAPAAILSADAAFTDAYMLTHALLQKALQNGLKVYDRTPLSKPRYDRNKILFETKEGLKVEAKYMINATGYEVTDMIRKDIVKLQSTYAIASENMPDCNQLVDQKIMIWNTADPYLYMRQTSDQRILIGGRDEFFMSTKKRDALIAKKSKQLENDFRKLFQGRSFSTEFRWAGTFGTTKDGLPYIGADRNRKNVFYALGFGGNGITFSLIAAQVLSDHFRGRKNKDAWIFDFNR